MPQTDPFDAFVLAVRTLDNKLPDRSTVEVATAVLDAADHGVTHARFDQAAIERSAHRRLSTTAGGAV